MGRIFRYRYVDFGTSFSGDPRKRDPQNGDETPATLFANELATDVGGTCWGLNEPLAVIDHDWQDEAQFPSASAAVLHKAHEIFQRFADMEVVWLVTHKEPDFDALCSMYLARWIIEGADPVVDWREHRLHRDSQRHAADVRESGPCSLDWTTVQPEHRWAAALGNYASTLEARQRISCPPSRALHSILFAALKRGRDYLNESSGAIEFFDEARALLLQHQLNPIFDSVMASSALFAPELALLDREAEAYQRDIRRARRSIVYLPESEAPSPDFFKHQELSHHVPRRSSDSDAAHLLLADTFRIPTDGIYLRDPESLLFREWVRLDVDQSSFGAGFEFTAIAYSNGRPEGASNKTDYQFSIDPERANGRHLYTVWSRLQTQEVDALRAHEQDVIAVAVPERGSGSPHRATLGSLLADPWVGGQSRFGNSVGTPQRGTLIDPPGARSDLRDDPVAEAVRTELESLIYSAASLVTGPQITVFDLAGSRDGVDITPQRYDLNAPLQIPAPPESYFRFASIGLRADVPISTLGMQIAEDLWQVLYPETPGVIPADFTQSHVVIDGDYVGVWGDRGIGIAQKQDIDARRSDGHASELRAEFAGIVAIVRDVDRLLARWAALSRDSSANTGSLELSNPRQYNEGVKSIVGSAQELEQRCTRAKHTLVLPNRDLLRRFCESVNLDQLINTLDVATQSASEILRQHELAMQAQQMESRLEAVARVQKKLQWLQICVIGFLAITIIDVITHQLALPNSFEDALLLLGGPLILGLAAWRFKPWRRKKNATPESEIERPSWVLIALAIACLIGWLAGLAHLWIK